MLWKDISSYSQRDTSPRAPRTFELNLGGLRLCVTRHIHFEPTEWVLTCAPWFSNQVVGTGTAEEAQAAALAAVRKKLTEALAALPPA